MVGKMAEHNTMDESMTRVRSVHATICREVKRGEGEVLAQKKASLEAIWQNYACAILATITANRSQNNVRQLVDMLEGSVAGVLQKYP